MANPWGTYADWLRKMEAAGIEPRPYPPTGMYAWGSSGDWCADLIPWAETTCAEDAVLFGVDDIGPWCLKRVEGDMVRQRLAL